MKRNLLFIVLYALMVCSNLSPSANANNWIVDDGVMELTPEYTVQHIQGRPYSDVYAAFNFNPQKKLVQLRTDDALRVNGHVLQGIADARGYYYQARIPVTEGSFTFTLTRAPGQIMTHSFELPVLGISELPKTYLPYEKLRVPVRYSEPAPYIARDSYTLQIHGTSARLDLISTTREKDNRYQIGRLPDIQDDAIVFRHISKLAPPPGTYPVEIYRQQRVELGKISSISRTGWATLSNTQAFTIEVKGK